MNIFKVKLTIKQIDEGVPKDPFTCPVARALNNATGAIDPGSWQATPEFLRWERENGITLSWRTPNRVRRWIKRFDAANGRDRIGWARKLIGTRFPPISFDLALPELDKPLVWIDEVERLEIQLSLAKRSHLA